MPNRESPTEGLASTPPCRPKAVEPRWNGSPFRSGLSIHCNRLREAVPEGKRCQKEGVRPSMGSRGGLPQQCHVFWAHSQPSNVRSSSSRPTLLVRRFAQAYSITSRHDTTRAVWAHPLITNRLLRANLITNRPLCAKKNTEYGSRDERPRLSTFLGEAQKTNCEPMKRNCEPIKHGP